MRAISDDFRQALNRNATLTPKATLTLANGTKRELVGDDIVDLETEASTSSESSFDIGACVVGKCSLTLNNHDGRFDSYDFTGATVVPYVGKTFDANRDEDFATLVPSTEWQLEPASDEIVHGTPERLSSGSEWLRCDLGEADAVDESRQYVIRVRYAYSGDESEATSAINGIKLANAEMQIIDALDAGDTLDVYGGLTTAPRTVLATSTLEVPVGTSPRYAMVRMPEDDAVSGLAVSCVPVVHTEWVRLGVYNVDQPDSYSGTISLDCLDNMSKLSRPYSDVTSTFPDKPAGLIEDIFRKCGMAVTWHSQPAYTQQVTRCPDSSSLTCLQAVADLCQMMGLWCRCDEYGNAYLSWYDSAAFEQEGWLDGGSYETDSRPYSDGSKADGGSFANYSSGASYNGGTFDTNRQVGHVLAPFSSTVMTDDVVVTGISVTASNEVKVGDDGKETNGADGETALSGKSGYVLDVKSNPFIEYGNASAVANALNSRIGGMRFRPLSATAPSDPSIEAGDSVVVGDRKGNYYRAFATTVSLKVCDSMTVKCSAKSTARNSATTASAATQAIVQARNELKREMTSRELAEQEMNERLTNASGLYSTVQTLSDGSKVYFFHDKPTVATSKVIWKVTAQAMAVSTDGGKTYATGLTADGNAILNRIYAIGIDADYINSGMIKANRIDLSGRITIGSTSEEAVSISNSSINFYTAGRESMILSGNGLAYNSRYYNASGAALAGNSGPGTGFKFSNSFGGNGSFIKDGVPYIRVGFNIALYRDGIGFISNLDLYDDVNVSGSRSSISGSLFWYGGTGMEYTLKRNGSTWDDDVTLSFSLMTDADTLSNSRIRAARVYATADSRTTGEIKTKSGHTFLTTNNFGSLMNGGQSYTGEIRIPYVYNNIMRQYAFVFVDGLLVQYYMCTPTDSGWENAL